MTREPIRTKEQMYSLLAAGLLGNTIRQYFSLDDWRASDEYHCIAVWGVRTLTPGGPCRLYCPREEVEATAKSFAPHEVNISCMIDAVRRVTLMAEVFMGDYGLEVYGIEDPPKGGNWRRDMPGLGRTYRHLAARGVLGRNLNANDLDDLNELLDLYPGHVVELSACDRPIGIYPRRQAVIWEVRIADGSYEQPMWKHHIDHRKYQRNWSRNGD